MLEVNSIYLFRNKKQIFSNFSLKLKKREIIFLLGKNGVGKTTLLDIISGLIRPNKGFVKIYNKEIEEIGTLKKDYLLYLSHKNSVKEGLSVEENLRVWLNLLEISVKNEDFNEKLKIFNLNEIRNNLVKNLSHGQKKRVSLTKVLFSESKLWLMDEPFNGLDYETTKTLKNLMENHTKKNGAVLFTSHFNPNFKSILKIELKRKIKKNFFQGSFDSWEKLK